MVRRIPFFFFIYLLFSFPGFGQNDGGTNGDFRAHFEEGNQLIEEGIFHQAIKKFEHCVELQPDNANANYKLGFSYLKDGSEKKRSLSHLAKAAQNITDRYDPYSARESQAPPMARYYYGRSLHLNMKLDSSISVYERFMGSVPKRHKLYDDAVRQVEMVKYAKEQVADPKDVELQNIGKPINTEYHEYTPVISVDESVMYFTSRRPPDTARPLVATDGLPFEDIYASYKDRQGEWGEPERLTLNSNSRHDAVISTSPDGQRLFIYRDGQGNGDIYQSWRQGVNEWSEPESMGPNINSDAWEPHGALSPDGSTFYFVSNRKGGEGKTDIYRCKKLPTGEWSKAMNLGSTINTPFQEDAPFIHPDGETMYFSSNGHKSMGGFDIFFSEKKEDGGWTEPINMGYPVNTVDDDRFFMTSADGKRGYYASQKEGGFGGKDIYLLRIAREETKELAVMKGFINVPEDESMPEDARVEVTDLNTGETKIYRPRERDGAFVSILPPCKEYKVKYMKGSEAYKTERIEVPCEASYQEINKEVYLNPVNLGESQVAEKDAEEGREWKVLRGQEAYGHTDVVVQYVDEKGNVTFTENLTEDGTFPFYQLSDENSYNFRVQADETQVCSELSLLLVDQKGKELAKAVRKKDCMFTFEDGLSKDEMKAEGTEKETEEKEEKELAEKKMEGSDIEEVKKKPELGDATPSFEKRYGYNELGLKMDDPDVQEFLERLRSLLEQKEKVTVSVIGSASHVPTETYASNEKLAKLRAEKAREALKGSLEGSELDLSRIRFDLEHRLEGPAFKKGSIQPKQEYLEHQFVRVRVE